jgi:hypothetical protein
MKKCNPCRIHTGAGMTALRYMVAGIMALSLLAIPMAVQAAAPVSVEILYMNHGPMQPTLREIRSICGGYGNTLTVAWYDSESPEGEKFIAKKGIKGHVPLIVWISGKSTVMIGGKEVQLIGFPTGSGPTFFQGKWTLDDLRAALDQAVPKK